MNLLKKSENKEKKIKNTEQFDNWWKNCQKHANNLKKG